MIKTVFMGTPDFALEALRFAKEKTDLKLVITKEDKVNGRGNKILFSPIKQYAIDNNLEYIQPKSVRTEEILDKIKEIAPDLIIVAAYGKIIPKSLIDIPKFGIINVHSSILPKYRGAAPIHYALMNGDTKTGISIMQIDEGLDTGDILEVKEILVDEDDNLETLTKKLTMQIYDLLDITLDKMINNTLVRKKQDDSLASLTKPIKKEETNINWLKDNNTINNLIRALSPKPLAMTKLNNEIFKIAKAKVIQKEYDGKVGEVVELTKEGPIVKCNKGALLLTKVKLEGKNMQSGKDIINGRKIKMGDVLYD